MITLLAALATVMIAGIPPISYFLTVQARLRGEVEIQTQLYASQVAAEARQNPVFWNALADSVTERGLDGLAIGGQPDADESNAVGERRRVFSGSGHILIDSTTSAALAWPMLVARLAVMDGPTRLGEVDLARSLRPALKVTVAMASGSSGFGLLLFLLLRVVPLRMLGSAQAALRESAASLDRAQEIAGIGSWELDLRTGRYNWSKELYRIRGLPAGTFEPNLDNVAQFVDRDDYKVARLWLTDLQAGADRGPIETRIIRPNGDGRLLRVEGRAVSDPDGIIRRLAGTMQDITEGRLIEQQLVQAQKMEAIGTLTGGMAHDFNNVLGVIIGNLDLLGRLIKDNPAGAEMCDEARDGALRCADLIRRLLAFARRQPLRPQRTDVNALVEGISQLLSRTLGEDIELTVRLDPPAWPVMADPAQLEATLTNLATNARDAMKRGGRLLITTSNTHLGALYTEHHPEVIPGEYVLIEISDTGTGIDPAVVGRIFEPFFTTKEPGKGTGLGLSMVFGFVKQSGGHVAVYSEPGRGSTFRIYLPRGEAGHSEPAVSFAARPAVGGDETVLVVEDNAGLRRAALQQLAALGYATCEADNAQAALDILASGKHLDLLFTDVVMPGEVGGIDLAVQATQLRPGLRVLLTSGFPDLRGSEPRATRPDYRLLNKPYRHDDLAHAVRQVLDDSTGHGDPAIMTMESI
jgi:signal transduction histidine kinase/CheY-like chemotaxis protein